MTPDHHPPRPRLTLRVGIAGHRPKPGRLDGPVLDKVTMDLEAVFAAIDRALAALHAEHRAVYSDGTPRVRLVSGMAEGADQIAVHARPADWTVDAILPFPKARYLEDFVRSARGDGRDVRPDVERALAEAETVTALPESDEEPDRAYARLGSFLLRQTDLLVVVWDGKPAAGAGGTADIVQQAIAGGIPVVWIATDGAPPRIIAGSDAAAPCDDAALRRAIANIVAPPAASHGHGAGHATADPATRLATFLAETWPARCRWTAYDMFKRAIEGRAPRLSVRFGPISAPLDDWEAFARATPYAGPLQSSITGILLPRYVWADGLAIYRSHAYRSLYIIAYLFAAIAVLIALAGVLSHLFDAPETALSFKAALVTIELVFIAAIILLVRSGRRNRWHERWLDYRALAEMLRAMRFLAFFGEYGRVSGQDDLEPASSAWTLWYLRATARELGVPAVVLDAAYQRAHLDAVERHVVREQIAYHAANAATLRQMSGVLHGAGNFFFLTTAAILAFYLLLWLVYLFAALGSGHALASALGLAGAASPISAAKLGGATGFAERLGLALYLAKDYVTILAAGLPAIGAALAGIRETGDFEGFAARSEKTVTALEALQQGELARARQAGSLALTASTLVGLSEIMTEDLAAWQSLYGRKHITLP